MPMPWLVVSVQVKLSRSSAMAPDVSGIDYSVETKNRLGSAQSCSYQHLDWGINQRAFAGAGELVQAAESKRNMESQSWRPLFFHTLEAWSHTDSSSSAEPCLICIRVAVST